MSGRAVRPAHRATTRTEPPLPCVCAGQGLFAGAACRNQTDDLITSTLATSQPALAPAAPPESAILSTWQRPSARSLMGGPRRNRI